MYVFSIIEYCYISAQQIAMAIMEYKLFRIKFIGFIYSYRGILFLFLFSANKREIDILFTVKMMPFLYSYRVALFILLLTFYLKSYIYTSIYIYIFTML